MIGCNRIEPQVQSDPRDALHSDSNSLSSVDYSEVNIRQDNLAACSCDYNRQDRSMFSIENSTLRQFVHKFNLELIKLASDFNHINLEWPIDKSKPKFRTKYKRFLAYLASKRTLRQKCFALIFIIAPVAVAILFKTLYHQHAYDFDKIRLERLVAKQSSLDERKFGLELTQIKHRVRESQDALMAIGAPHMEWGMVVESVYVYFLQAGVFTIVIVPLYFNFHRCAYFPWARYFLNAAAERRTQVELIADQIEGFVKSSRTYTRLSLEPMMKSFASKKQAKILDKRSGSGGESTKLLTNEHRCYGSMDRLEVELNDEHLKEMSLAINTLESRLLYQKHCSSCQQAYKLALMGYLNPLVDRSSGWLDKLALLNISILSVILFYSAICLLYLYLQLEKYLASIGRYSRYETLADLLMLALAVGGVEMMFQATAFLFSLCYLSFLDLLRTLRLLRQMILHTTKRIDAAIQQLNDIAASMTADEQLIITMAGRFAGVCPRRRRVDEYLGGQRKIITKYSLPPLSDRPPSMTDDEWHGTASKSDNCSSENLRRALDLVETIETDITAVLLGFKYFCTEFERLRAGYEMFAFIIIYVPGSLPVFLRLYMAYINDNKTRLFLVGASIAAAPSFFLTWPYCYIHKRCLDIYKALLSLAAQLTDLESNKYARECLNIDHQTSLLRKQLERPDLFSYRFAIRLVDLVGLTYPNVMRMQFWISLITISMLIDISPLLNEMMDKLLADPFRVLG
jgi:hypothetical protein